MTGNIPVMKPLCVTVFAALLASCGGGGDTGGEQTGDAAVTAEIQPGTISDDMLAYEASKMGGPRLDPVGEGDDVDAEEDASEEEPEDGQSGAEEPAIEDAAE